MPVGLSERTVGQFMILKPSGRIDSQSSPEFETAFVEKLKTAKSVIVDFADVPYVSSAGLRVILLIAKKIAATQGQFGLASMKPEIHSVFKISGLSSVLKIFDTPEAAMAAFGAS